MALEREQPLMTYDAYEALPEGLYDLLDGVLYVTPSGTPRHQDLQGRIYVALAVYLKDRPIGRVFAAPLDVVLQKASPAVVVQPDVLFIATTSKATVGPKHVRGAPDLVVEVLSPGNARMDSIKKREIYQRFGVLEYWMVLPDLDQVEVLRLTPGGTFGRPTVLEPGDELTTDLLPEFALDVADLFGS